MYATLRLGGSVNKQPHSLNFGGDWPKSYSTTHWMFLRHYHRLRWLLDGVATQFMPLQRESGGKVESVHPLLLTCRDDISETKVQWVRYKDQDLLFM